MVELGTKVKDSLTGFTGVATARTEYLYGCVRVCVEPQKLKDGSSIDEEWFDEQRLSTTSRARVGGPQTIPKRSPDAP